jgi:hypothetical protein
MSSLLIAAFTALLGVFVFVAGQFVQKFVLEPLHEQRTVIGEIAFSLLFYANVMDMAARKNEGLVTLEDPVETVRKLRGLAGKLRASLRTIPYYRLLAKLKVVPNETSILAATQGLIGWSNSIHLGEPDYHRRIVAESLGLKD